MADFKPVYDKHIIPNEGGYALVAHDGGLETVYGISRRYHPNWPGWVEIDRLKNFIKLKNGQFIPRVEPMVEKFYHDMWDRSHFGLIQSQKVAAITFDFFVNSGYAAIRTIQRIVRVPMDGLMGPRTIDTINRFDPDDLYLEIIHEREQFYLHCVEHNPTQQKFWAGWMARLKRFENENNNVA